jgi:uncharacterized membrane-anchored protein
VTSWLRLALAAQLGFFGIWGAALLTSHRDAPAVWLATKPVDPRDLLSGNYVALRYGISSSSNAGCDAREGAPEESIVYVRLEKTGDLVYTKDGPVETSDAVACQEDPPTPSAGEQWIVGRRGATRRRTDIAYGIERFYLPEESPLRDAQSGHVVAKILIADGFEARIVDLVPTFGPGDMPPS